MSIDATATHAAPPPATENELDSLREQRDALALQAEAMELRETLRILDLDHRFIPLAESVGWGEIIPRNEYPDWGEPTYSRAAGGFARLEDRQDGRFLPVYENEHDLRRLHAIGRNLGSAVSVAVGAMESLFNYVFDSGFTFTVQAEKGTAEANVPAGLVESAQRFIDTFLDDNDFAGVLDKDTHRRCTEDGEALLSLAPHGRRVAVNCYESEQLTEPANRAALDTWLLDSFGIDIPTSWSFGVHSPTRHPNRPLGYHVIYDSTGSEWEYLPADRAVLMKRNVTANAKRGVSDYYPVSRDLLMDERLTGNLGKTGAIIAAIVGVRMHAKGNLKTDVQSLIDGQKSGAVTRYNRGNSGSRSVAKIPYEGANILDAAGYEWSHGPLGASNGPNLSLIAQHIRRSIGVRWTMPEYLISGDASNASYASTSIAAEAWVKARQSDQRFYGRHWLTLVWKAMRLAYDLGWFDRFGLAWADIEAMVDVAVGYPEVSTRDFVAAVTANSTMIRDGYMSRRTAAAQQGLDYDAELENREADEDGAAMRLAAATPATETGESDTMESVDEALRVIRGIYP